MKPLHCVSLLLVSFAIVTGCKSRDFNTDLRGKVDSPETRQPPCRETLNPNSPYTPELLIQQLTAAINQAGVSKTFDKEAFRDILFSDDVEAASRGALKPDVLAGDNCSLVRAINESNASPRFFFWLTGNGRTSFGGLALYKGDVFAEGFYRNRSAGVDSMLFARKRYGEEELLTKQPWFEWNKQSKKFTPKMGNPLPRLLLHASQEQGTNALTLHRGTNTKFADKAVALASLNSFLFGPTTGGIFTTPSYGNAKGWASPVVLTARVDPKLLTEAASTANLNRAAAAKVYGGIEFDYVEIAFLYAQGDKSNLFFDNITAKCVVSEKAQANEASFAAPCK